MASNPSAEKLRKKLIAGMRESGAITDDRIETAFLNVPRHLFLPNHQLEEAYTDTAVPIKHDGLGMVISSASQPTMMALMLDQLALEQGQNVLEIGSATGYNAAVMQYLVGSEGRVSSIELDSDLARFAETNLFNAGFGSVRVVRSDGSQGYAPRAAYDRIISTVGVWDIPLNWIHQLKPDGRLIAPIWLDGVQVSATFTLEPDGTLYSEDNRPCAFVYIRGEAAGPTVQRPVGSTSLVMLADDVTQVDTAALHSLLSDDYQYGFVGDKLSTADYWYGFQLYLMLNELKGYIFAVYVVLGDKKVYGLEGQGVALIAPASVVFAPYAEEGSLHLYGGADALLTIQEAFDIWNQSNRPGMRNLRLRLIPMTNGKPDIPYGKLYIRRNHYLHVWLEEPS